MVLLEVPHGDHQLVHRDQHGSVVAVVVLLAMVVLGAVVVLLAMAVLVMVVSVVVVWLCW